MKQIISFLTDLKLNNNRDWFNENKLRYEEAKETLLTFVGKLIPEIKKFDDSLGDVMPKDTLFRIYRDIRFSNDKTPYKENMGAFIANGGKKSIHAGYYIHIEPRKSFLGGGSYCPPKEILQKIRSEIYYHPEEYISIIEENNFKKYFNEIWGDKLSRPPKGFDPNFKYIDFLKNKSYVASNEVDDEKLDFDILLDHSIKVFRSLFQLNQFINRSL